MEGKKRNNQKIIIEGNHIFLICDRCKERFAAANFGYCSFSLPTSFTCPKCAKIVIDCPCGKNEDYTCSLVQCMTCKKYQHKRHVGLGFGKINDFICPRCRFPGFRINLPSVNCLVSYLVSNELRISKLPHKIQLCPLSIPKGPLLTELSTFTTLIEPMFAISGLYNTFYSNFYKSHPFLHQMPTSYDIHQYIATSNENQPGNKLIDHVPKKKDISHPRKKKDQKSKSNNVNATDHDSNNTNTNKSSTISNDTNDTNDTNATNDTNIDDELITYETVYTLLKDPDNEIIDSSVTIAFRKNSY